MLTKAKRTDGVFYEKYVRKPDMNCVDRLRKCDL